MYLQFLQRRWFLFPVLILSAASGVANAQPGGGGMQGPQPGPDPYAWLPAVGAAEAWEHSLGLATYSFSISRAATC